jgi:hypothetical protein
VAISRVAVADLFGMGFGRAETPQFVKPRITPPLERIILPAVRAMLLGLVSCLMGKYEKIGVGVCTLLLLRCCAAAPSVH